VVIRSRKSKKDRQYSRKKDKRTNNNLQSTTQNAKLEKHESQKEQPEAIDQRRTDNTTEKEKRQKDKSTKHCTEN
jgi:hypothetical protein